MRTETMHFSDTTSFIGTAGGTALTIVGIGSEDVLKTMILAAFGAVISFAVTLLLRVGLKWFLKKIGKG